MKMSGLTNEYVEGLGKKVCGKFFLGTFPCDLLPKVDRKKSFSLIINLSKHNTNGSHFVALFADKNILMYFDPLDNKCNNKYILKFIRENKKKRKIKQKFKKIQSDESIFCGYFCIAFLLSRKLNLSFKLFFSKFDYKNLKNNDSHVISFIQNHLLI